jgi:SpoVK/Ycf46/Vps4 family AAA+-type ATPase
VSFLPFAFSPGTGKTSVAKLYGTILADLGLLSKGEVVYKCASDFVGDVLGSSEKITRGIIESAEGCVLVIDEAYALYSGGKGPNGNNDPYKTAVIDTIVEQVQAKPGADIAVVMLGYQAEMENMLAKVNPGLSRRFQLENAFHFPDFDDSALIRIMKAKAREQDIELSLAVAKRAVRTLAKARAKPNFGNAGAVDNVLSQGISRMQLRGNPGVLTIEDFDYKGDGHDNESLETLFDDLIGCKEVRETMDELRNTVVFAKSQGKSATSNISYNYLFLGSPGTGKTTVARRMGVMFHALGLLPGCEMKEIKASDLLTGYVGQAGQKTRELLREARGGVLFIDEAYQLDPQRGGSFMTEAVDELVGALTDEEFKGRLLVILAGYDQDMERNALGEPRIEIPLFGESSFS